MVQERLKHDNSVRLNVNLEVLLDSICSSLISGYSTLNNRWRSMQLATILHCRPEDIFSWDPVYI